MFWALLGHVGVPWIVGVAFAIFALATERRPFTWNIAVEIGIDFTILSIGAVGALFDDPRLIQHFGDKNALIGVTVAVFNVFLGSVLMLFKRSAALGSEALPAKTVSPTAGIAAIFVGFLSLFVVGAAVASGYRQPQVQPSSNTLPSKPIAPQAGVK
jgi:hypothetical protein